MVRLSEEAEGASVRFSLRGDATAVEEEDVHTPRGCNCCGEGDETRDSFPFELRGIPWSFGPLAEVRLPGLIIWIVYIEV